MKNVVIILAIATVILSIVAIQYRRKINALIKQQNAVAQANTPTEDPMLADVNTDGTATTE